MEFLSGREASKILGVHQSTLRVWDEQGSIETIGTSNNQRRYNVQKYLIDRGIYLDDYFDGSEDLYLSYVRVSSRGQIDDLERQKELMLEKYPDHNMIEDVGSGINLNRRGLRTIIDLAIAGKVKELVVVHKDRLTSFGFDLIEDLIKKYSGGKIIIINQKEDISPEEELVKDVLQLMNVFVAKMNGLRKYKKIKIKNL